jgi:AcrR family transcriptional regulator
MAHAGTVGGAAGAVTRAATEPVDDVAGDVEGNAANANTGSRRARIRMSGRERRHQLLDVGLTLFAEKGFDGASIEEVAARAGVSKPVVYEHFGGKDGLYALVVDREMRRLLDRVTLALRDGGHPRQLLERAALSLLDYVEQCTDGFHILVRDCPVTASSSTFASLISEVASQVEHTLGEAFRARGYDARLAPLYSQALVGMVALTGQWWLDARRPPREEVAAHLVNLAWNGLSHLEVSPQLSTRAH